MEDVVIEILIVDNNPDTLADLAKTLTAMGFRVVTADPANPAASAESHWRNPHLQIALVDLFLDPSIPGEAGREVGCNLISQLTTTKPEALVVGITGQRKQEDEVRVRQRGGKACYQKWSAWHDDFRRRVEAHLAIKSTSEESDFEWALEDDVLRRKYSGQVVALHHRRVVGAGETYEEAGQAILEVMEIPPEDEVIFVPIPHNYVVPGSEFGGFLKDEDVQQRFGGLVVAIRERQIVGTGTNLTQAKQSALRAGNPVHDLEFALIPGLDR